MLCFHVITALQPLPLNGMPSMNHSTEGVGVPSAAQLSEAESPTLTLVSTGGFTHLGLAKNRNVS